VAEAVEARIHWVRRLASEIYLLDAKVERKGRQQNQISQYARLGDAACLLQ